jgi:transposase
MRWKPHVRFGERAGETDRLRDRHRAPVRLHLGLDCVDQVRRRVQQDTLGHRGRARDPLYDVRRLLRRRRDRLGPRAWARLQAGLLAGDPTGEVTLAWTVAQDLMALYQLPDPARARQRAQTLIADLRGCPIPELARLGRTLHAWRDELCAHFAHPTVSDTGILSPPARPALRSKPGTAGSDPCR